MNRKISIALLAAGLCVAASAFSPYENRLTCDRTTRVMLATKARPEQAGKIAIELRKLTNPRAVRALRHLGIEHLAAFSKKPNEATLFFVYFDYSGKDYLQAVKAFESIPEVKALAELLEPLPPAPRRGNVWLQLEWINYIHGAPVSGPPANRFAMVTRIKPDREEEYRFLHQTTWPGIVDWMNRKGWRDFSIFLAEIDGEIYEFFYVEEVPSPNPTEDLDNDPTLKRWLKLTDPCQNPLPDADGTWSKMTSVIK